MAVQGYSKDSHTHSISFLFKHKKGLDLGLCPRSDYMNTVWMSCSLISAGLSAAGQ